MSLVLSFLLSLLTSLQSRSAPPYHLRRDPHPRSPLLFRLLPSRPSPSLAVPKAPQSTWASRHPSVFPMRLLRTLLPSNSHILHRGKRRPHPIIIRSQRCIRANRTASAAGHCLHSAMFSLLLPCRHILPRLYPSRVSRRTRHCSRLHSLTYRHSWSHPLSPTSRPHNPTTSCSYLFCFDFASRPFHANSTLLVLDAISRLIYSLWLKTTTIQRGAAEKKKVSIFIIRGPVPPTSIALYPLSHSPTVDHDHIALQSSVSHTPLPHPPCLVGRRRDDRYPY